MFKLWKKLGLATLLVFGAVSSANASLVVLDTFDYDFFEVDASGGGATTRQVNDVNDFYGDVLYSLQVTSGPFSTVSAFSATGGELTWGNANSQSILSMFYSELGAIVGSGPLDLTGDGTQNAFYFDILSSDFGFDIAVLVSSATGQSLWEDESEKITELTRKTAEFSGFDLFSGTGADFSEVLAVEIFLTSSENDVDVTLAEFGTIPEPTTVALFGLALIGFAFNSRRKAK